MLVPRVILHQPMLGKATSYRNLQRISSGSLHAALRLLGRQNQQYERREHAYTRPFKLKLKHTINKVPVISKKAVANRMLSQRRALHDKSCQVKPKADFTRL
jgi:hypothetical protein